MVVLTKEQRKIIIGQSKGRIIMELSYDEEGKYWVMQFTDGTEFSFRFMSELI